MLFILKNSKVVIITENIIDHRYITTLDNIDLLDIVRIREGLKN